MATTSHFEEEKAQLPKQHKQHYPHNLVSFTTFQLRTSLEIHFAYIIIEPNCRAFCKSHMQISICVPLLLSCLQQFD